MTIDHERPEDELHSERALGVLTVFALIADKTGGREEVGAMPCPVCRVGIVAYDTRGCKVGARCSTVGCIRVTGAGTAPRAVP